MSKPLKKTPPNVAGTKLEPKGKFKPVEDAVKKLSGSGIKQADFARQLLRILPEQNHTVEDTLRPEYWAHVAPKLQITDKIEALWKDNTRYAEYIVVDKGTQWAKVVLISDVDFSKSKETKAPKQPTQFAVSYGNHEVKYIVTRLSDGERMSKDHKTQEDAEAWMAEHRKSQ
tara:strand:- start:140 stop:655 length:516 start_codon:yes stop_codon:yes gene_type:complete